MFIIHLTYTAPLEAIDQHAAAHRVWVDAGFADGVFIASGPLTPTSYNISGNGQYQHPQFGPMKSGFHYQGRYLGACKS